MSTELMIGRDIYMRHTDKDGKSYVQEHRVWNADRFVEAQLDEALKLGGKAMVQQITHEQYLRAKGRAS